MRAGDDWRDFDDWHGLFDALCMKAGYLDNLALAERLCAANGNKSHSAFEAAIKNLRNWREGIHLPQRKNLTLLGQILGIDSDPDLRRRWAELYRKSRTKQLPQSTAPTAERRKLKMGWPAMAGGAATIALAGALMLWPKGGADADPVGSYDGVLAEYVRNVTVKVGDAMIIHGARGNECGPAPSWEQTLPLLPEPITGTLSDGGVGTRFSRQCGGRVPARAVLFTATAPGTEQISLYGDPIVIRVSD